MDNHGAAAVIMALLNQKGGGGKTTLALHLAGQWDREGKRVLLIDADPPGSALDWSEQRAKEVIRRHFGLDPLAADTRSRDTPGCARDIASPIVVGALRVAGTDGAPT